MMTDVSVSRVFSCCSGVCNIQASADREACSQDFLHSHGKCCSIAR